MNKLMCFNFGIQWELYKKLKVKPITVNVNSARKKCGVVLPKKDKTLSKSKNDKNKKETVVARISEIYPDIKWEKTKQNNFQQYCFDIADSFVISRFVL